jgi:hypothetical protein
MIGANAFVEHFKKTLFKDHLFEDLFFESLKCSITSLFSLIKLEFISHGLSKVLKKILYS